MVTLTERAAIKVKELLAAEGDPVADALRVAVEGGGCSGFQYALGFDTAPEADDETYENHGVRVIVDRVQPALPGRRRRRLHRRPDGRRLPDQQPERGRGLRLRQLVPGQGRAVGETVPEADSGCDTGCGCSH